jgi:hypothetical protein
MSTVRRTRTRSHFLSGWCATSRARSTRSESILTLASRRCLSTCRCSRTLGWSMSSATASAACTWSTRTGFEVLERFLAELWPAGLRRLKKAVEGNRGR